MVDKEEGEVSEEGELPDEGEAVPEAAAEQSAAPVAQDAPQSAQAAAAAPAQQPTQHDTEQQQQQQPASAPARPKPDAAQPQQLAAGPAAGPTPGAADRSRDRSSKDRRAGADPEARHQDSRHRSSDREKAELSQELDKLTADLTFQEIRTNWGSACPNIKAAIKKLDKLLRKVKRKREDDVELYPPCHEFAGRILSALKHVTVITSTGLGKTVDMDLGHNIMKTAVNYRHDILSAAQKKELEAAIRESKEFQYLFTDRDKGRPKTHSSSRSPGSARQQQQQDEPPQQQRVPLARGDRGQQQQQQPARQRPQDRAVSGSPFGKGAAAARGRGAGSGARGSSPAAAATAAAAAGAPPPPDAPAVADSSRQQQQQQQQQPAAVSGGKPAPAAAAAATANRSAIKIVLSSTAVGAGSSEAAAAGGWQQQQRSPDSPAAAGEGGRGSTGSGLSGAKRGPIEIRDLDADDDDFGDGGQGRGEQQASKRARVEQQEHVANGDPVQRQQQQVAPWESEEHRRAVDNVTPLQAVMSRLLDSGRLVLVLDLDHTLVNSVKFSEVDPEWEYKLEQTVAEQLSRPKEHQDLHRLVRMGMWTKLRPGVREFLRQAAEHFELWIYTAGSKPYADAMAELLDPEGRYFGGRVIAQGVQEAGEDGAPQPLVFKRLLQGLEGCEPIVLIVDDSSAVWPNDRRNLFIVERYIYFPSSRKRLGMAGKSLMEVDRDECPQRGMLMTALRVFEMLHAQVFERLPQAPLSAQPEASAVWDVRNVLAAQKRRVLEGVELVFSRVIPLETNPRQHPLWLLAEQYGATCSEQCTEETTHVVAMTGGTEKAMWARQHKKHVVGPAWLECSCIVWQRAAEERFPPPQG